jgi:hypothetical protein
MMDEREDRLDAMLRDAAQDYNAPPPTPRAEMWARIQAGRRGRGGGAEQGGGVLPFRPADRPTARPTVRLAIGIAALVALGIGIGRFSAPSTPGATRTAVPTQTAQVPATDTGSPGIAQPGSTPTREGGAAPSAAPGAGDRTALPTRLATTEHLTHIESFLTEFTTRDAPIDFAAQAQDLLGTTRLLIDSKRVRDVRTRKLLEDLELILVQIAALDSTRSEDRGFIADGLAQNHLRTRLRNAIPVGPAIRM